MISQHDNFALTINNSREDQEVATKYSQLRSLLLQLIYCCVAMLELYNVVVILLCRPECSASQLKSSFIAFSKGNMVIVNRQSLSYVLGTSLPSLLLSRAEVSPMQSQLTCFSSNIIAVQVSQ